MEDEDLKILVKEDQFLQIGKKRFKIWVSAERSLLATGLFNKISMKGTEEHKQITTDLDFYMSMLDVAFLLIRQDFKLIHLFDWIQRERLSKEYILKHMDIKELATFIDNALEPIIGTKKKELEREQKAAEAMLIVMDNLTPKEWAKLLQNFLQVVGTKKAM